MIEAHHKFGLLKMRRLDRTRPHKILCIALFFFGAGLIGGQPMAATLAPSAESKVIAKLAMLPTYIQNSQADLLTVSVGMNARACKVGSFSISPARCSKLAKAEIMRRKPIRTLFVALKNGDMVDGKAWVAYDILKKIDGPEVEAGLSTIAHQNALDLDNFLALMYFADRCQDWALRTLNQNRWQYGISSFVWAEALADFGQCKYWPATPGLINDLNAASLNAVDAAYRSLRNMYPDGPHATDGPDAVKVWKAWISEHKIH